MKVEKIISVIERYEVLKDRLRKDRLDYENYRILEPDEEQEKIAFQKVRYDLEEIGKFLDMEV